MTRNGYWQIFFCMSHMLQISVAVAISKRNCLDNFLKSVLKMDAARNGWPTQYPSQHLLACRTLELNRAWFLCHFRYKTGSTRIISVSSVCESMRQGQCIKNKVYFNRAIREGWWKLLVWFASSSQNQLVNQPTNWMTCYWTQNIPGLSTLFGFLFFSVFVMIFVVVFLRKV